MKVLNIIYRIFWKLKYRAEERKRIALALAKDRIRKRRLLEDTPIETILKFQEQKQWEDEKQDFARRHSSPVNYSDKNALDSLNSLGSADAIIKYLQSCSEKSK